MDKTPIDPKLARALLDIKRLKEDMNRAYDALREGQSTLATSILGQALGYETPDYGNPKAQD